MYIENNKQKKVMKTETCKKCDELFKPSKEILNIHDIQTNDLNKQFETFDESLFKSYINKFNNEDKLLMLSTLACEISTVNPILNNLLNQISSYKGTK